MDAPVAVSVELDPLQSSVGLATGTTVGLEVTVSCIVFDEEQLNAFRAVTV